jgi:toxin ParE1/3/4
MAKKHAEYRLTPAATRDLEAIWLYMLKEWGTEQANRYIDELDAAFNQLATHPQLGQSRDHIRQGYRRNRVGRHAIYFRVTDYGIAVIRLLHERMDAPRHL